MSRHDIIPVGSKVILKVEPRSVYPILIGVMPARKSDTVLTGVVTELLSDEDGGGILVRLDGTNDEINMSRSDLIFPIPGNLVAFRPNGGDR